MIDTVELRLKTNGAINCIDPYLRGYRPTPYQIIELLDRLEAAEKVCKYVYKNTGMHCSAIGKCIVCNKASTRALDMVCDRCITEAVLAWQKVKDGQ